MTCIDRRRFLAGVAAGAAATTAFGAAHATTAEQSEVPGDWPGDRAGTARPAARRRVGPRRHAGQPPAGGLADPVFRPLPIGAVRPRGWLLRQLRIQADGLTGHLDEFWPDVAQSQWFGGTAEGWERAPYWLDGAIPLAWILDDGPMKARIAGYMDHIVSAQRADGWYAPYPADASAKPYDLWAMLLANKALVQYHEAAGDERVLGAVERNLRAVHAAIGRTPLFDWGSFRAFEGLIPAYYVYERTREPWLIDLARALHAQEFDYKTFYATHDVTVPTPRRGLWKWTKHVVNTAMAPKAHALAWRARLPGADPAFPARMIDLLDRCHGQVTGMFTGDECLAGLNPLQGTELCAVVEFMYSLEVLVSILGEARCADRLERVAFNALPATFSPDMWAHQYDQQVNQVQCTINPEHQWTTNGPESNLFGLEPNFGCCTANMHQGWPKFTAHLVMKTADEGGVVAAWAPCEARFESRGVPVRVSIDTDYPFREFVTVMVAPDRPARFPLLLRVPAWAGGATVRVAGGAAEPMTAGTFHRVDREWAGPTTLELRFPMRAVATRRYNGSVAIERGPLVYALKLGEAWTQVNTGKPHRELPHGDFEVRPTTPWNYGIVVDERAPEASVRFAEQPVGERPFSPEGAGVVATARGRLLPDWTLRHGWAQEFADRGWAPIRSREPVEEVTLIPYGCTNIRLAEFPLLKA